MADIHDNNFSQFSAADSALGYLYQVRTALLWALRKLKTGSTFLVSLETLDDVAFETKGGMPNELLQTKHHRSRVANLADASPDLWKSLRVWFEGYACGVIPSGTSLYLLTTATASNGSVAANLRSNSRNLDAALQGLVTTAQSSTNKDNASAYKAFLNTSIKSRRTILENVVVIDAAPDVTSLDSELRTEIFWAVKSKYQEAFVERLEGWWLRRALKQLVSIAQGDRILSEEIEAQMFDLSEQFRTDSLPIDEDLLEFTLDKATHSAHTESVFVQQLNLIGASKRRIAAAIRDYYRAFQQRSRWLRNDLLLIGDLDKYERRLIEEWDLVFEAMKDEIGSAAADEVKEKAARDVLIWAERTAIPIRPRVTEPFVTRGSLHMLADEQRIGWHPEFRERLAKLLGVTVV